MKFVYDKSLHWLGLNYKFIPFIIAFFISISNVILGNGDTLSMFDSWLTSNGSTTEQDIASKVGTQNLLAEQAQERAAATRKELELSGYEYHEKKTGARNIESFTPSEKAQMSCQESINNFRKSIAREESIKKSHKLATDNRGIFDLLRETKIPSVREVTEEVTGQNVSKPVLGSRNHSRTRIAAATSEAAAETIKWSQFTELVCGKKSE